GSVDRRRNCWRGPVSCASSGRHTRPKRDWSSDVCSSDLANSLTYQVRNISQVTTAVAKGDLSKKITVDAQGEMLDLKDTINKMVDQLDSFAGEVTRVAREVGTEGKLAGQAHVRDVSGVWKDLRSEEHTSELQSRFE